MTRREFLLIAIGALAFVFLVWVFAVIPQATRLPADFSFTAEIASQDNFYDPVNKEYTGAQFSQTEYGYETLSTEGNILTVKNFFHVRTLDGETIVNVERAYGINRRDGSHVTTAGDKERIGYLFAPRNLQVGESFTYWHVNYDGPALMEFESEEELYGLRVFKYRASYDGISIDQTEDLTFLPGVGETRGVVLEPELFVWIEPVTGRLVKYQDNTIAYFYDLETQERLHPWNHFSNTFLDTSVRALAFTIEREKSRIIFVKRYVPIALGFLILLLFGFLRGWHQTFASFLTQQRTTLFSGMLLIVAGVAALLGWMLNVPWLVRPIDLAAAMNPVTALCFIGIGSILVRPHMRSWTSLIIAVTILILSLLRIIEVIFPLPFSVDLILFREAVISFPSPARMALYTAVSFGLLAIGVLTASLKIFRNIFLPAIITITVLVLAIFSGFNFFIGTLSFFELPLFFSSAVLTSVLFFIAALTLLIKLLQTREKDSPLQGTSMVAGVLMIFMFLVVLLIGVVEQSFHREARNVFEIEVAETIEKIEDRVEVYVSALVGTRGLFEASDDVSREEFRAYVDALDLHNNYPGVQGVGYSVFVEPHEWAEHIQLIRSEGFPNYTIKPAGERNLYSAIVYLEPFDIRNQEAFGYDMYSNEIRRVAMNNARDTGAPHMSGKITLVQEIDEDVQPGFLIYIPYYEKHVELNSVSDKQEHIVGYVYSPFRARNFFEGIIGVGGLDEVGLSVTDGLVQSAEQELYDDTDRVLNESHSKKGPRFIKTETLYIAGRPWTLTFTSTPNYGATSLSETASLLIVLVGILFSVLMAVILFIIVSSRQKAVEYAKEVTKDLSASKKKIESVNKEITERLSELERINRIMVDRELKMIELKKELNKKSS